MLASPCDSNANVQPDTNYPPFTRAFSRELPPALLFGSGLTLVGVMRAFGRAGVPFYVAACPPGFHTHSRWYRTCGPDPANPRPDQLCAYLHKLPLNRAVLVPCSDDWAQAVANLPADLRNRFAVIVPCASAVETMVDKWRFAQFLTQQGIPHPATELLCSKSQVELLAPGRLQGQILKPISSVEFVSKHGLKGFLLDNQADACRAISKVEFPILLQEYIPGPPTASFFLDAFVDRQGRVAACFARRRLRIYPNKLGNSTLMESIPLQSVPAARDILNRIIAAAEYRGILSAEFKYDHRDGLCKIIEINPRPWWYIEFAARCGVDICALAYCDALGMTISPVESYRVGQRCVFFLNDCRAYRHLRRLGMLNLWSWMKSCLRAEDALFQLSDPMPFLALAMQIIRGNPRGTIATTASQLEHAAPPNTVLAK